MVPLTALDLSVTEMEVTNKASHIVNPDMDKRITSQACYGVTDRSGFIRNGDGSHEQGLPHC